MRSRLQSSDSHRKSPISSGIDVSNRSSSPLSSSLHLFRAYSRDRLPLTATLQRSNPSAEYSPGTPKSTVRSEKLLTLTPTSSQPSFHFPLSEPRYRPSLTSPFKSTPESNLPTPSSLDFNHAETALKVAISGVTVKLLQLLSDHTIVSKEMERTMYALLVLCAEVDKDIEVGGNCKVMMSRAWPLVRRYLQSPGHVIQTLRKIPSCIHSKSLPLPIIHRAHSVLSRINESQLKLEKGGNVGIVLFRYLKSVIDYAFCWYRLPNCRKNRENIDFSPTQTRKTAFKQSNSPISTPKSVEIDCFSLEKPKISSSSLTLELDYHFQCLLLSKIRSKTDSMDLLDREKVLSDFQYYVKGKMSEEGGEVLWRFLGELRNGLYEAELQRVMKLVRLGNREDIE